jgi:hypothetical protein
MLDALVTTTLVAATPAMVMVAPAVNPVPVTVIGVPPCVDPADGEIPVTCTVTGGGAGGPGAAGDPPHEAATRIAPSAVVMRCNAPAGRDGVRRRGGFEEPGYAEINEINAKLWHRRLVRV